MSVYSIELRGRLIKYLKEKYDFDVPEDEVDAYLDRVAGLFNSLRP